MSLVIEAVSLPEGPTKDEIVALASGFEPAWYTSLNPDQTRPAWFLARRGGVLVGFLSVFNPSGEAGEVSAYVAPEHRRGGVFTALWSAARSRWDSPGLRWLWVVDRGEASGVAVAERHGELAFTESTLRLEASSRPRFLGLPAGLTVVPGTTDDLEAALEVLSAANGEGGHRGFLEAVLGDPSRQLCLLQEGGRTVATAGVHRNAGQTAVFGLAVHPERQGRGWGRALVVAVLELASSQTQDFFLEVDSTNGRAEGLYRSLGFRDHSVTDYYEIRKESV